MSFREILCALIITLVILALNLSLPTMLRQDDTMWQGYLENHRTMAPFSLRPLVTQATSIISNLTGLSIKQAFIINQYPLLFLMFLSFAVFLKRLGFKLKSRLLGMMVLGFCYPILCIHFIPNYTWDDIWLYLGIIWMSYFLIDGRIFQAAVIMLFTTLGREHILMFAPVFLIWARPGKSLMKIGLALAIPILGYAVYRYLMFPDVFYDRFQYWAQNFADIPATRQSLYSLMISFGWVWIAAFLALRSNHRPEYEIEPEIFIKLKRSALIIAPLAVAIVLILVKARETRIFFPPFIYLIPMAIIVINKSRISIREALQRISFWIIWLVIFGILTGLMILLFPGFLFLPILDFHRVLLAIHLTLALMLWIYYRDRKQSENQ